MSVLIKILKFIGKALLWVLTVILVILAVILICPIKYEIKGEKYENISFKGRIKLFFGILTVKFKASAKGLDGIKVELFGKKLGGKKKKKAVDKDKETAQKKTETNDSQNEKPEAEPEKKSENEPAKAEEKTETAETTEKLKPAETVKKVSDEWNDKKPTGNSAKVRRIKLSDAEKNIAENKKNETAVKKISLSEEEKAERKDEKTDTDSEKDKEEKKPEKLDLDYFIKMPMADKKQLFKAVVKLLKSLLKGIKPDDFYVKGDIGFEDPSTTAEIVGAAYAIGGILNKKIELKAVFDKEILQGEAYAKGKIIPIYMLVCLIRFVLTKQVRKIIKIYLKGSGDKNGK